MPSAKITAAMIFVIFTDFCSLYLWIMISGGNGRKKYMTPRMISETDAPIAPTSLKNEYRNIHIPIAITKIPLIIENGFWNFSLIS